MVFDRPRERATSPTEPGIPIVPFDPTVAGKDGEALSAGEYVPETYARRLGHGFAYIANEGLGGPNLHLNSRELAAFETGVETVAQNAHERAGTLPGELRVHFGIDTPR